MLPREGDLSLLFESSEDLKVLSKRRIWEMKIFPPQVGFEPQTSWSPSQRDYHQDHGYLPRSTLNFMFLNQQDITSENCTTKRLDNLFAHLFSASWDLRSSMLGLKRTPITSLHLVAHNGRVGVFSLEPMLNELVVTSSLSHRRNPIWLRSTIPSRERIWMWIELVLNVQHMPDETKVWQKNVFFSPSIFF